MSDCKCYSCAVRRLDREIGPGGLTAYDPRAVHQDAGILEELAGPFGRSSAGVQAAAMMEGVHEREVVINPGHSLGIDCDPCNGLCQFSQFARHVEEMRAVDPEADERAARKATPVATGVLAYFPDALEEVSRVSKIGNDQHNPGEPLHWNKDKSTDEADALVRHLLDRLRGQAFDTDGARHLAKVAWRALALLQRELDEGYER